MAPQSKRKASTESNTIAKRHRSNNSLNTSTSAISNRSEAAEPESAQLQEDDSVMYVRFFQLPVVVDIISLSSTDSNAAEDGENETEEPLAEDSDSADNTVLDSCRSSVDESCHFTTQEDSIRSDDSEQGPEQIVIERITFNAFISGLRDQPHSEEIDENGDFATFSEDE